MFVLLVGHRGGAVEAARAMNLEARLLLDAGVRQPSAVTLRHAAVDFGAPSPVGAVAQARALCGDERPAAVVALTERAVVVAAHVREALGVDGLSPIVAHHCHDKVAMKDALGAAAIACADFELIDEETTAHELIERLGLPLVIKVRDSSGSRGTLVAGERDTLERQLVPGRIAEAFVHGVEMSVESFVSGGEVVFVNFTEYLKAGWANIVPADISEERRASLEELNRRVIEALGIERAMTHLEVFITARGLVVGEIAVRPPGGHLMELIQDVYGIDTWRTVIEIEMGKSPGPITRGNHVAGVWLLHPGPGQCLGVSGLELAGEIEGIVRVGCRLRSGDEVTERLGVGQSVGRINATGASRDEVARSLREAFELINIEMQT